MRELRNSSVSKPQTLDAIFSTCSYLNCCLCLMYTRPYRPGRVCFAMKPGFCTCACCKYRLNKVVDAASSAVTFSVVLTGHCSLVKMQYGVIFCARNLRWIWLEIFCVDMLMVKFSNFDLRCWLFFIRCDISVICSIIVLKLDVTVFTG